MDALLQFAGYGAAVAAAAVIVVGIEALNERDAPASEVALAAGHPPRRLRALLTRLRHGRS